MKYLNARSLDPKKIEHLTGITVKQKKFNANHLKNREVILISVPLEQPDDYDDLVEKDGYPAEGDEAAGNEAASNDDLYISDSEADSDFERAPPQKKAKMSKTIAATPTATAAIPTAATPSTAFNVDEARAAAAAAAAAGTAAAATPHTQHPQIITIEDDDGGSTASVEGIRIARPLPPLPQRPVREVWTPPVRPRRRHYEPQIFDTAAEALEAYNISQARIQETRELVTVVTRDQPGTTIPGTTFRGNVRPPAPGRFKDISQVRCHNRSPRLE